MCNKLVSILLITSIGLAGCSSTATTRYPVNSQPITLSSQTTYPQIEETVITNFSDVRRQTTQSTTQKHVRIRRSPDPLDYIIAAVVICTIELILLDECEWPDYEFRIKNQYPSPHFVY